MDFGYRLYMICMKHIFQQPTRKEFSQIHRQYFLLLENYKQVL